MGWNTVEAAAGLGAVRRASSEERFYFVHSYGVRTTPRLAVSGARVTWAEHGGDRFIAAVEYGAAVGHPVPPGEVGRGRRPAAPQLGGRH